MFCIFVIFRMISHIKTMTTDIIPITGRSEVQSYCASCLNDKAIAVKAAPITPTITIIEVIDLIKRLVSYETSETFLANIIMAITETRTRIIEPKKLIA